VTAAGFLARARLRRRVAPRGWPAAYRVVVVVLILLISPLVAEPQPPTRIFRIVELNPGVPQEQQQVFRRALRELGYVPGRNIVIEDRFAAGSDDRLREYAAEAVRLKVDVIVAISSAAILAATSATKTIPIVGLDLESDPVASGFIASLARPGGNLTGMFVDLPELTGKGLELLKEAIPGIVRVGVLRDPALDPALLRVTEPAARALGLQLQLVEARGTSGLDSAFSAAVKGRNGALMVIPSPRFDRKVLSELAVKHRLPTTSIFPHYAEAGLLMSYGPNLYDLFTRAATYVDRILKGARPGDLPVQRPARFEMVINARTATALGIAIPQSLRLRADRVVD
jgi:putative ABC transport system substrate-binding protein